MAGRAVTTTTKRRPQARPAPRRPALATFDEVLSRLDEDPPRYRELYYQWEREQWEAGTLDLRGDRRQWAEELEEGDRLALGWLQSCGDFWKDGRGTPLPALVDAAPGEDRQVVLTTHLVDDARQAIFFGRVRAEVMDGQVGGGPAAGPRARLLSEREVLSRKPARARTDVTTLIEGLVLCHLVLEATIGLSVRRFLMTFLEGRGLLPGLRRGLLAVARDECRHIAFAQRVLGDLAAEDEGHRRTLRKALRRLAPVGLEVLDPAQPAADSLAAAPFGPEELHGFARSSLERRLEALGLPALP